MVITRDRYLTHFNCYQAAESETTQTLENWEVNAYKCQSKGDKQAVVIKSRYHGL
jgi:hypothetical protein